MKRINLTKYGFVRWPEQDFSDDGNRFQCYRAGKIVNVSKLVSDGRVYLSADSCLGKGTLPYDIYSKLPHYHTACWDFNGVAIEPLTDKDLEEFFNACVEYEKEYEAAEASIEYPTIEELKEKAIKVTAKSISELAEVKSLMSNYGVELAMKCTPYEWRTVQEYIRYLGADTTRYDPEIFPYHVFGKIGSFDFIKSDSYLKESFWYKSIRDLFVRYCVI